MTSVIPGRLERDTIDVFVGGKRNERARNPSSRQGVWIPDLCHGSAIADRVSHPGMTKKKSAIKVPFETV